MEVRYGRNYETIPATVILVWILLKIAQADAGVLTRGWLVLVGASAGFLFILSPPAGLAAILSLALFHLLRVPLSAMVDCASLRARGGRAARWPVGRKKHA